MCSGGLVGDRKYYLYLRQMRQATSGQSFGEICMSCIGDVLLEDPQFLAKLMAKVLNHPGFWERAAEGLLAKLQEVKAASKKKPPGD
jgi:hypothetical protein